MHKVFENEKSVLLPSDYCRVEDISITIYFSRPFQQSYYPEYLHELTFEIFRDILHALIPELQ